MASEPLDGKELSLVERRRLGGISKVYTRRFKGRRNNNTSNSAAAATTTTADPAGVPRESKDSDENTNVFNGNASEPSTQALAVQNEKSLQQEQSVEAPLSTRPKETAVEEIIRLGAEEGVSCGETGEANDRGPLPEGTKEVVPPQPSGNEGHETNEVVRRPLIIRVEDRIRISITGSRSRNEIFDLRRKLEDEVGQVRSLFKNLEAKELQLTAYNSNVNSNLINSDVSVVGKSNAFSCFGDYNQPQYRGNELADRRTLTRVSSEVGYQEKRPYSRSLSVSVVENNHGGSEFVEREKRTPKANQFYRKSEFLLGKDRLPPESNKKLKPNGAGRKHGREVGRGFGFSSDKHRERMFRSCSSLLQRLMKHTYGWVFNEPVDAKKLGLHDYHDIIKHPMDLGTIKTRLSQNYYRSPREFAEDVRLVFRNAMTYNPKGQDVHAMAEKLLNIFEERWSVIEMEYNPDWRNQMYHDAGLATPTFGKVPQPLFPSPAPTFTAPALAPTRAASLASTPTPSPGLASVRTPAPSLVPAPLSTPVTPFPQTGTLPVTPFSQVGTSPLTPFSQVLDPKLKLSGIAHVGRPPALKKPKAKDPNKRDMTYEEKQRLSTKLQTLPSEKLDAIVQIIKKRNSTLDQHDGEIEVDIDSVDAETLWELDRFVTNYKKSLSKNRRKAERAVQAKAEAAQVKPMTNTAAVVEDAQKERGTGDSNGPPAVETEKQANNACRSSSSSSSSSDSGSSSSDSDSDSSSASESDAGHSPGT